MYIAVAIIAFGLLIAVHELGHFFAAKACGVKVNEFALGMGPPILKKQRGETLYSLRLLPLGGYCAMEGEDIGSPDPRSFNGRPVWMRLIILIAGSFMNFLLGLIIALLIFTQLSGFATNEVVGFAEGFPLQGSSGLMVGDEIIRIDGHRIFYASDFTTYMNRSGGETVDITVRRDGSRVKLNDLPLTPREYRNDDGTSSVRYGVSFDFIRANAGDKVNYAFYETYNFVRSVWLGLTDLVKGAVGVRDLSGVVGIVDIISETGEAAPTASIAMMNIAYIVAFIAVNLAVMNMLPIPALDGGRVFFLIITWLFETLTRKHVDPKYEGYIHKAGMALLFTLMAFLIVNDILRLVRG